MTDRLFRFSQTTKFMQSRSNYWLKYVLNLQKKYPTPERPVLASDVGTIAHHGMHSYYLKHSDTFSHKAMQWKARGTDVYDTDKLKIADAYDSFDRHVEWLTKGKIDDGYETLAVEKRLYVDFGEILGDAITLTFEPDLIQLDLFGSIIVRDWKFVTDFDRLARTIDSNRQGLTYCMGVADVYGQLPVRFELRQTNRKPPKTKAFVAVQTNTQWITPEKIARHRAKLMRTFTDMVRFHQEVENGDLSSVYSEPMLCGMFGQPCSDYEVCCGAVVKSEQEIADILARDYEPKKESL